MHTLKRTLSIALATTCLLATSALAERPARGETVGPLSLHVDVGGSTFTDFLGNRVIGMTLIVENLSPDLAVHALVKDPVITFSDGTTQRLRQVFERPMLLGPNEGRVVFPLVLVDPDAPLGLARVHVDGHVASLSGAAPGGGGGGEEERATGGTLRHSDWAPMNHARAEGTFTVAP